MLGKFHLNQKAFSNAFVVYVRASAALSVKSSSQVSLRREQIVCPLFSSRSYTHAAFRRSFSLHTHTDQEVHAYPKAKDIHIPLDKVTFSYARSSGPGGQNVNKLNTKAELRFLVQDAIDVWIPRAVAGRLLELYGSRVNANGEFIVVSQEHRTQNKNKEDCVHKLQHMLEEAYVEPKDRKMWTGISDKTKVTRKDDKRHRSTIKENRRAKFDYD